MSVINNQLIVACVLKIGGVYNMEYVYRLHSMVKRNLRIDHRFVCLTDSGQYMHNEIERRRLMCNWPGWWSKIELFRPGLFDPQSLVLYFDLDTIITSGIERMTHFDGGFAMLEAFKNPALFASGVMMFKGDFSRMFGGLLYDPRKMHNSDGTLAWDQNFIHKCVELLYQTRPTKVQEFVRVKSYKKHLRNLKSGLPNDVDVVCFHGEPRIIDVADKIQWVKNTWK